MSRCVSIAIAAVSAIALLAAPGALGAISSAADYPSLLVTFPTDKTVTVTLTDRTPVGTSSAARRRRSRPASTTSRSTTPRSCPTYVRSLRPEREARDEHVVRRGAVGDLGRDVPAELDLHVAGRQAARDGVHVPDDVHGARRDAGQTGSAPARRSTTPHGELEERQGELDRRRRLGESSPFRGTILGDGHRRPVS